MADETVVLETPIVTPAAEPVAAVTPAAEPVAAPAVVEPKLTGDEAIRSAVGKVMDKTPGFQVTKPEPVKPAVEPAKPAEIKAEEPKPGEAPKVEEVKPVTEPEPANLEQWTKALNDNPEVAAKLEEVAPGITETISDWGRKAAVVDAYIETGLVTPELAKVAADDAQKFYGIEEAFPQVNSPQSLDKFVMDVMVPLSYIRDEQGNPVKNQDGTFQTDGSTARFFQNWNAFDAITTAQGLDQRISEAKKVSGEAGENQVAELERIKEALITVQNYREAGYQIPKAKDPEYKRSAEDQALIDKANKDQQDAARTRQEAAKTSETAYMESVMTEVGSAVSGYMKSALDRTSFSASEKELVAKEVVAKTFDDMSKNGHFQRQKQNLYALGEKPEVKARLISLARTTFETLSRKHTQELTTKYGGKVVAASKAKLQKIDTQIQSDKMNQGGGTTPGAIAPSPMTTTQVREQAIKNLKASGMTHPEDGDILQETLKIRSRAIA